MFQDQFNASSLFSCIHITFFPDYTVIVLDQEQAGCWWFGYILFSILFLLLAMVILKFPPWFVEPEWIKTLRLKSAKKYKERLLRKAQRRKKEKQKHIEKLRKKRAENKRKAREESAQNATAENRDNGNNNGNQQYDGVTNNDQSNVNKTTKSPKHSSNTATDGIINRNTFKSNNTKIVVAERSQSCKTAPLKKKIRVKRGSKFTMRKDRIRGLYMVTKIYDINQISTPPPPLHHTAEELYCILS